MMICYYAYHAMLTSVLLFVVLCSVVVITDGVCTFILLIIRDFCAECYTCCASSIKFCMVIIEVPKKKIDGDIK